MIGSNNLIEGYFLVGEIGNGGMGIAWRSEKNGRTYTIKMYSYSDENSRRRFFARI